MNSKKRFLLYLLSFFIFTPVFGQQAQKTFKVVIDAGHGGHDPGCLGSALQEKQVVLNAALSLGKLISENCPDVQVVYTRKTDVFVELYRRAQIANNAHADLFISIHCNASENHAGNGVETFVMGLAKSEANQAVARKENAAMLMEKNYKNNYDGFDPSSPESNVIFSLYSSAYLNKSIMLADKVQRQLVAVSDMTDRGVKQAGYWVLYKVAMPSILIELGFLSNPSDESYLAKSANLQNEAIAIYNAFVDYVNAVGGYNYKHLKTKEVVTQKEEKPAAVNQALAKDTVTTAAKGKETLADTLAATGDEVRFRVQFLASPVKLKSNDSRLQGLPDVRHYSENGLWKYTAGNEETFASASEILNQVKKKYKDAFMIAFHGEKKITITEARQLLKK